MRYTKYILPLLLALAMLSTMLIGCDDTNETEAGEGLEYELTENGYIVAGIGSRTDTAVVIPAEYNEKPVIGMGENAFYRCENLTSITIPDSVTDIDRFAFFECTGLTSITIPDSVTDIGEYVFSKCAGLTSINFKGTKAQWEAIRKDNHWDSHTASYTIHCTDGDISK